MSHDVAFLGGGEVSRIRQNEEDQEPLPGTVTAFAESRRVLTGELKVVVSAVQRVLAEVPGARILVFDNRTGETIDWDPRGWDALVGLPNRGCGEVRDASGEGRSGGVAPRGPGRPRLGVVAREVTLLPRHWEWLAAQPGGASVALRKLVEQARRATVGEEEARRAREATYRFMAVAGGNEPGFEEAIRALFAGERERFESGMKGWPTDIREQASRMARASFKSEKEVEPGGGTACG